MDVIKALNISKKFRLPHERHSSLKQTVLNLHKRSYEEFQVLEGIDFSVKKGEFFGIVGRNGSGKSTLLKILAGIYQPSAGAVQLNGHLTPFIELGVGFNPELTGRDNVYLNGTIFGMSKKQIDEKYKEIVAFAELEKFMDQKLKNYSSGMQVRLAFSIAIQAQGDILLLDEVLAVGDEAFRRKCNDFFAQQKGKRTIVLVTHDMTAVEKFCSRAMLINEGKIKKIGSSSEIAELYRDLFAREQISIQEKDNRHRLNNASNDYPDVRVSAVSVVQDGKKLSIIQAKRDFTLEFTLNSAIKVEKATLGFNLINSQGNVMLAASTKLRSESIEVKKGVNTISFKINNVYTNDVFSVNVALIDDNKAGALLLQESDIHKFEIEGIKLAPHSLTHPNISISIKYRS